MKETLSPEAYNRIHDRVMTTLLIDKQVELTMDPEELEILEKYDEQRHKLLEMHYDLYPKGIPSEIEEQIDQDLETQIPGSSKLAEKRERLRETFSEQYKNQTHQ